VATGKASHVPDPPPLPLRVPPSCPGSAQVQREQFTRFINKATGRITVALGTSLRAAKQTWQVIDRPSLGGLPVLAPDHRHARRVRAERGTADGPR
jgi:hypothetical protein